MNRFATILQAWPVPVAAGLCGLLMTTAMIENVDIPDWLVDAVMPAPPEIVPPEPDAGPSIAYAPVPGRDDRTPPAFMNMVFGLEDPTIASKLTGIGPVLWDHSGQGTGALIGKEWVLSTGHLFAKNGKWEGPHVLSHKPPPPSDGYIYLEACGEQYHFAAIHLGAMAPRARLGLDYAIAKLDRPACDAAQVLPVALTPDERTAPDDNRVLNMGAYRIADLPRYAQHPLFAGRSKGPERFAVFGVRCAVTHRDDTGGVADGTTAVIITEGCDGIPGGSGGPLLFTPDGGVSYAIVGVANSYKPNSEYNNYTRIEGAFAAHLGSVVDLIDLPQASAAVPKPSTTQPPQAPTGPWLSMRAHPEEISK